MKKVLILHNIISPIRVHLFNELNAYYQAKGISFKVIFLSVSDKNRDWKTNVDINFNYEISDNFAIRIAGKDLNTFFINPKILKIIKKENPDQIISFGWDNWATYVANWWCHKNDKISTLWCGSTKYEKSWRRTIFNPLVKYLIKRTTNFIAYGSRAKEYLISLGINEKKIQIFYNTIDIDYFQNKSADFNIAERENLKKSLSIKTSKIILFSGRIIEMKGIFEMVSGFNIYYRKNSDISLILMGTGPDKHKLQKYIKEMNIKNIFFTGFIQYANLYKYYAISDLLLFPSRQDVWGLVLNEAAACGLPIITPSEVGASVDLIQEGKNGYIIELNCPICISESIDKIFNNNLHKNNSSSDIIEKLKIKNILKQISL